MYRSTSRRGWGLAVICERDDPHDAFVSTRYANVYELPQGAIVGTSSLRRQCQLPAPNARICKFTICVAM
ncbi:hypothetical protein [uncultured Tolumonas sp.]|uniref:hypothetical protein n=1 Tax=uncultured Tolumonas sp. TaxID=263765 RepID=UPI00374832EE